MRALLTLAVFVALLSNALPALADPTPEPLIEKVGFTMTAQEAMERIAFRPFVPSPSYTSVALLPAFHGDDKDHPENRGIGYAYVSNGVTYVLREWPRAGGSIHDYQAPLHPPKGCTDSFIVLGSPRAPRAVAWQTTAMAYTLQPDLEQGNPIDAKGLLAEWARLAARGACR
jgi:hypothetical protein